MSTTVLGRDGDSGGGGWSGGVPGGDADGDVPTGRIGVYRARDGSDGAPVSLDLDRPHAALVVGKRGTGKSYTLGVVAEEVARAPGVAPVVVDPVGAFSGLAELGGRVVRPPRVAPDSLPPSAWPSLLGLDPSGAAGALVWQAAASESSLASMRAHVADADATRATRRAATNHLDLASSWDVFDTEGLTPEEVASGDPVVLDCSTLTPAATNAVVRAVARGLYDARLAGRVGRLPWLLVDEAHVLFDGIASPALETLLTRGRVPGVSIVAATQRPSALPDVAVSQADLLVAHRLTSEADVSALAAARPTFLDGTVRERLPAERGCALVVDDATEATHVVRIRERITPHGGDDPRASAEGRAD
ncbi:MAG: ATP-binding protein [Haloferacaceae archaeon]